MEMLRIGYEVHLRLHHNQRKIMIFQLLSLLLAVLSLSKASIALTRPDLFYRFRQQQYSTARIPVSVLIVPSLVLARQLLPGMRPSSVMSLGAGCSLAFSHSSAHWQY